MSDNPKRTFPIHKYKSILIFIILIFIITINIMLGFQTTSLSDYGSFYASGQALLLNRNPYDISMPTVFQLDVTSYRIEDWKPLVYDYQVRAVNLNPPIILPLTLLASQFDPYNGLFYWRAISIFMYSLSVVLLAKYFPENNGLLFHLWAVSIAGFWSTIAWGQIYTVLLLLVVCLFIAYKKHDLILAGIFLGILVAIKPNFAVWMLFLLSTKQYKIFISSIISSTILSLLPLLLYGPEVYQEWFEAVKNFNGISLALNNSLPGLLTRFDASEFGLFASGLLIVAGLIVIHIKKLNGFTIHNLGIIISLIASPIAWAGYTITVVPIIWLKKRSNLLLMAMTIFTVPYIIPLFYTPGSYLSHIFCGWFYGWAILILLIIEVVSSSRNNDLPQSSEHELNSQRVMNIL